MGGGERPPDVSSSLARTPRLTPAADALLHTDVPVVAAVNGAAVGWGMELSLMADFRVASEKAKFGELFVLRGLVSDAPGLGRLAQLVGREKAAEMLMTGEVIDAAGGVAHRARRVEWFLTTSCCRRRSGSRSASPRTRRSPCKRSSGAFGGARSRLERGRRVRVARRWPSSSRPRTTARACARSSRSARRNFTGADPGVAAASRSWRPAGRGARRCRRTRTRRARPSRPHRTTRSAAGLPSPVRSPCPHRSRG